MGGWTRIRSAVTVRRPGFRANQWSAAAFDDRPWPRAYEHTDEDIGVTTLTAYTRYPDAFEGARWIWTVNLVHDNVVLARKTVR